MPITVRTHDTLTKEDGPPLLDPTNVIHRVVPRDPAPELPLLSRIDWYGTTGFRSAEVRHLIVQVA